MLFEEKLCELRKKNGMSQEELAEKINVTRQTVSKWELGQTQPDLNKLMELSKVFNVGIQELTDIEATEKKSNIKDKNNSKYDEILNLKPRKWILVILVIIEICIVVILLNKININRKSNTKSIFSFTSNLNLGKNSVNFKFENNVGVKNGFFTESVIDEIIENNSLNKDHIVKLTFEGETTDDIEQLSKIKNELNSSKEYNTTLNYDENGFVNEVIINETEISKINFANSKYKSIEGKNWGKDICEVLDKVISNNKQELENIITVKYMDINSSNEEDIKKIKKSLDDYFYYDSTLEYNDRGFISAINIVENYSSNARSFNSRYLPRTTMGVSAVHDLDEVIENNNKNSYHLISVTFKGNSSSSIDEIKKVKAVLNKDWENYEITYNYDENGYVNEMVISKI